MHQHILSWPPSVSIEQPAVVWALMNRLLKALQVVLFISYGYYELLIAAESLLESMPSPYLLFIFFMEMVPGGNLLMGAQGTTFV